MRGRLVFGHLAAPSEDVADADAFERHGAVLGERFADGGTEPADDIVLFRRDDGAGFSRGLDQQFGVDRFQGVQVDHLGTNPLGGKRVGGFQRQMHHIPDRDDRDVGALAEQSALPDLKRGDALARRHFGNGEPTEAKVDRTVPFERRFDGGVGLGTVGGADHRHTGDHAHQGEVLAALVRRAVLADRDSGVRRADLDVQVGVGDRVAHLLERASGGEHGKRRNERNGAGRGDPGGNAHHVALGDPAVEEPVGMLFCEQAGLGRLRQVGVEDHEGILVGKRDQRFSVRFSGCDLISHSV